MSPWMQYGMQARRASQEHGGTCCQARGDRIFFLKFFSWVLEALFSLRLRIVSWGRIIYPTQAVSGKMLEYQAVVRMPPPKKTIVKKFFKKHLSALYSCCYLSRNKISVTLLSGRQQRTFGETSLGGYNNSDDVFVYIGGSGDSKKWIY